MVEVVRPSLLDMKPPRTSKTAVADVVVRPKETKAAIVGETHQHKFGLIEIVLFVIASTLLLQCCLGVFGLSSRLVEMSENKTFFAIVYAGLLC